MTDRQDVTFESGQTVRLLTIRRKRMLTSNQEAWYRETTPRAYLPLGGGMMCIPTTVADIS